MKKIDDRDFESVVRGICRAEEDVDRVLKAARLTRKERSGFWGDVNFMEIVFGVVFIAIGLGLTAMILLIVSAGL